MHFSKDTTRYIFLIIIGVLSLSGGVVGIFAVLGKLTFSVLLGSVIGSILAILNFFLLALSLEKAVQSSSEKSKGIVMVSYNVRMLLLMIITILAIVFLKANPFTILIPYIFPRITILLLQITGTYRDKKNVDADGGGKNDN